jgi:hypothetical protein
MHFPDPIYPSPPMVSACPRPLSRHPRPRSAIHSLPLRPSSAGNAFTGLWAPSKGGPDAERVFTCAADLLGSHPETGGDPDLFNHLLRFMKNAIIIGVMSATIVMVGCSKEPSSSSTTLAPDSKPVAVSGGSPTFSLGATTINGTNVATNVTVGIRPHEASK